MTLPAPTYDLVLLLDPQAEEPTRTKIVADARTAIEAQGELLRHDEWGERALAYPIDRKASAIYHLLQFHVGETELLDGLDRTLQIADEVLRFRIIKLAPGVPPAPDMSAGASARRAEGDAAPAAPTPSAASAPAATSEPSAPSAPAAESPPSAPSAEDQPATEVAVGDPS
ncbi:MAG TPA: 30S ribosomal protein S6 [Solirubrobacteraceae bacterium]|jgi:small subunit ribosomal protein S6|nr:30S ribosomal protein S6 [Solirubrobacteraceae bacterium]